MVSYILLDSDVGEILCPVSRKFDYAWIADHAQRAFLSGKTHPLKLDGRYERITPKAVAKREAVLRTRT